MGVEELESGVEAVDISESLRFSVPASVVCTGIGRENSAATGVGDGAEFHEPSR